jgi:hypothetical protein
MYERVCSAEGQMFLDSYAGMSTKKIFLTRLVADLIVCSAEGQMFLATYAGMSTKKNLSDTLGGGSQAVSPEKNGLSAGQNHEFIQT